jgi:hypothetical protein
VGDRGPLLFDYADARRAVNHLRADGRSRGRTARVGLPRIQGRGPIDFALTGILTSIAKPLAEAGISIFALSTFDTDYVLMKNERVEDAVRALEAAGHQVSQ